VSLYSLFVSRFILGVALGLNSILVIILSLIAGSIVYQGVHTCQYPRQHRVLESDRLEYWVVLNVPHWHVKLIPKFSGLPEDINNNYWRILLLAPMIPCLIRCVLLLTCMKRDTPLYYMKMGNKEKVLLLFI
jgi:hypothetical protein